MTKLKSKKELITEAVLQELPDIEHDSDIGNIMFDWWFTGRQNEGLRLTDAGKSSFERANIEYYDHEFRQDGQSYYLFVSELSKKIKCPYYLGVNKTESGNKMFYIRLYDSKIAMMLKLYGSIQEYLQSVK